MQDSIHTGDKGQVAHQALFQGRPKIAPAIREITDGVWTIVGISVANSHVIKGSNGLILVDSGNSLEDGKKIMQFVREVSNDPVKHVIYTHSHYVHGTSAVLASTDDAHIYAHKFCHKNVIESWNKYLPAHFHRLQAQYGVGLPDSGEDADPSGTAKGGKGSGSGYLAPDITFQKNGSRHIIGGIEVIVYTDYNFDTDDSLILHLPEKNVVIHNHFTRNFPNMYSIAGGMYRKPLPWLEGLDTIRSLQPDHLLGCHGLPLSGQEDVQQQITSFRDALQFIHDQTLRALNMGLSADEAVSAIHLPKALQLNPSLSQTYSQIEFHIRAIACGEFGWYSGDAVDLHPVSPQQEAKEIVSAYGGVDRAIEYAKQKLQNSDFGWAAKLTRMCLHVNPDHTASREILASALRAMGQRTPGWTTRNAYLVQAREWEGKLDRRQSSPKLSRNILGATDLRDLLRSLGYRLNSIKLGEKQFQFRFEIENQKELSTQGLVIRHGIASPENPGSKPDAVIGGTREQLESLFFSQENPSKAWSSCGMKSEGNSEAWKSFLTCLDACDMELTG